MRNGWIFLCLWLAAGTQAEVTIDYRLYDLPLAVELVQRVGSWHEQEMQGYYRVFLVRDETPPGSHQLFIQWVCDCQAGRLSLLGIDEINGMARYQLSAPSFRRSQAIDMLTFEATNVHTNERLAVQVQLLGIGRYRIASRRLASDIDERYVE